MRIFLLSLFLLICLPITTAWYYVTPSEPLICQQDTNCTIHFGCINETTLCTVDCNLSIYDPRGNILVNAESISPEPDGYYSYLMNTSLIPELDYYSGLIYCGDSGGGDMEEIDFIVTYHGRTPPPDFIQVLFILAFILVLCVILYTIFLLVRHFESKDMDLLDVLYMFGIYLTVFSLKYFNMEYMGSYIIDTFADLFIDIGSITHIILPIIVFIICFMKRRVELKEENV